MNTNLTAEIFLASQGRGIVFINVHGVREDGKEVHKVVCISSDFEMPNVDSPLIAEEWVKE